MSKNDEDKKPQQPAFDGMLEDTTEGVSEEMALAIPDEDSAAPMTVYSSVVQFNPEDITPPVLKLMQGLSPEVQEGAARPGQWSLSGYPPSDSLTIVPLSYARRREYRDPDTNVISCVSYGGENGQGTPGGTCADCPMNKWTGEGKSRRGPQCVFMYSYIVYIAEYDTGAILNFKRTGLSVGRSLNSAVSRMGFGHVVVKISGKIQTGGKGTYYIPQLVPITGEGVNDPLTHAAIYLGK